MGQYLNRFHNKKRIGALNKRERAMRHDMDVEEGTRASALSPPSAAAFSSPVRRAPFLRSRTNSEPLSLNMLNGLAPKATSVFQKNR